MKQEYMSHKFFTMMKSHSYKIICKGAISTKRTSHMSWNANSNNTPKN
jgi:hypothetical protein